MTATIEYREGNIFTSGADFLVCPVNCVGTMGKGLAKDFKSLYPGLDDFYQHSLRGGKIHVGQASWCKVGGQGIILFPTKWHWKEGSELFMIDKGLKSMFSFPFLYHLEDPKTIALPKLGCGLGGLRWDDVRNLIESRVESQTHEYATAKFLIYE